MYRYIKSSKSLARAVEAYLAAVGLAHLGAGLVVWVYRARVWGLADERLESCLGSLAEVVALVALVSYLVAAALLVSAPVSRRVYRGLGKLLS